MKCPTTIQAACSIALLFLSPALARPHAAQGICPTTSGFQSIGDGTGGSSGVPLLAPVGLPVSGHPLSLRVANAQPLSSGFLYYGFSEVSVPLPAFGATVYLAPAQLLQSFATDSFGSADSLSSFAAVPPTLCGQEVIVQALVLDSVAQGGAAFTRAAKLRFGRPSRAPLFSRQSYGEGRYYSVVTGDLNGDGLLDMAGIDSDGFPTPGSTQAFTVSILLGNGDGSFESGATYTVNADSKSLAIGDIDGNGSLDLVVDSDSSIALLAGIGDGTFTNQALFVGPLFSEGLRLGDMDADGDLDVAILNRPSANAGIYVYRNDGSGNFTSAPSITALPQTFVQGDFLLPDLDGDGSLDVYLSIGIFARGLGNGSFGVPVVLPGGSLGSTDVADLNGDGILDVVTAAPSALGVRVRVGTGGGNLNPPFLLPLGGVSSLVKIVDSNMDGTPDIIATSDTSALLLEGVGGASFLPATVIAVNLPFYTSLNVHDLDTDGDVDLILGGHHGSNVLLAPFEKQSSLNVGTGAGRIAVAVGDLDGDGNADLVSSDNKDDLARAFVGNGDGTFSLAATQPLTLDVRDVELGDVSGDGKLDLLTVSHAANSVQLHTGLGDGTFAAPTASFPVGTDPVAMELGDVNGDGRIDVITANSALNEISVLMSDGTGSFLAATGHVIGGTPNDIAIGDFDGDGILDVIVGLVSSSDFAVLLGLGGGALGPATLYPTSGTSDEIAVADVNHDRAVDVVISSQSSSSITLHLGAGNGTFGPAATTIALPQRPNDLTLADCTGDGDIDLIYGLQRNIQSGLHVVRGNGNGTFGETLVVPIWGGQVISIHAADLNNDGALDLVAGCKSRRSLTVVPSQLLD